MIWVYQYEGNTGIGSPIMKNINMIKFTTIFFLLNSKYGKKGPNVQKRDQKGTIFSQKSLKGTFAGNRDLIGNTAHLSQVHEITVITGSLST